MGSCADYLSDSLDRSVTTSIFEGLRYIYIYAIRYSARKTSKCKQVNVFIFYIYLYRYISWGFFFNSMKEWKSQKIAWWYYDSQPTEFVRKLTNDNLALQSEKVGTYSNISRFSE